MNCVSWAVNFAMPVGCFIPFFWGKWARFAHSILRKYLVLPHPGLITPTTNRRRRAGRRTRISDRGLGVTTFGYLPLGARQGGLGDIADLRFDAMYYCERSGSEIGAPARAFGNSATATGGAGLSGGLFDRSGRGARAFLNPAFQFLPFAFGILEIVFRERSPPLFQLALDDVPATSDFECGHDASFRLFSFAAHLTAEVFSNLRADAAR